MFGMGTGVTLLLWPPGNLVSGVSTFAGCRRLRRTGLVLCGLSRRSTVRCGGGIVPEHVDVKERSLTTEYSPPSRRWRFGGSTGAPAMERRWMQCPIVF